MNILQDFRDGSKIKPWEWIAFVISISLFLAFAGLFAQTQSIWVDETTQLSGLTLEPREQILWLSGKQKYEFGVPPDRMPPLSYWLGWGWSQVFGLREDTMRWFGITCVALGIPGLWLAARRLGGPLTGVSAILLLVLSCNTITIGPEIRAYPLFLAVACWVTWAFVGFFQSEHRQLYWGMLLFLLCVFSMYTHFYGVVLFGSIWLVVAVMSLFSTRRLVCIGVGSALTLAGAIGFIPFVGNALNRSPGSAFSRNLNETLLDFVSFVYRLVAHPSSILEPVALALLLGGISIGGVAALTGILLRKQAEHHNSSILNSSPVQKGHTISLGVLSVIVVGLVVTVAGAMMIPSFDGLKPRYSIWLHPFVLLFVSTAASAMLLNLRVLSTVPVIALGAAVVGSFWTATTLMSHRSLFSHGPSEWIANMIEESAQPVSIVHDARGQWGFVYFPIRYRFGDSVEQWLVRRDGRVESIQPTGLKTISESMIRKKPWLNSATTIWVTARSLYAKDLASISLYRDITNVPHNAYFGEQNSFGPPGEVSYFYSFVAAKAAREQNNARIRP
jgi:hypothetical protein